jgi:hypothetical protein
VIYMVGTSSAAAPGEKIIKNPIAVRPAREDQKLHPMSRINFGKIYTIEHNVKVMNVGKVADESLYNLWHYFINTHRWPNEQSQHVVSDDGPVQRPQTINHGRRLSVNHGSGLPTISGSGLLKTTRIAGDTKGHSEVMYERKSD